MMQDGAHDDHGHGLADDLAQMIERHEMLAPEVIERLEEDLLLDIGHDFFGVALDAAGIILVGELADALGAGPDRSAPFVCHPASMAHLRGIVT